jgi:hypothetical protein
MWTVSMFLQEMTLRAFPTEAPGPLIRAIKQTNRQSWSGGIQLAAFQTLLRLLRSTSLHHQ